MDKSKVQSKETKIHKLQALTWGALPHLDKDRTCLTSLTIRASSAPTQSKPRYMAQNPPQDPQPQGAWPQKPTAPTPTDTARPTSSDLEPAASPPHPRRNANPKPAMSNEKHHNGMPIPRAPI